MTIDDKLLSMCIVYSSNVISCNYYSLLSLGTVVAGIVEIGVVVVVAVVVVVSEIETVGADKTRWCFDCS